jgi:hypothetical protein
VLAHQSLHTVDLSAELAAGEGGDHPGPVGRVRARDRQHHFVDRGQADVADRSAGASGAPSPKSNQNLSTPARVHATAFINTGIARTPGGLRIAA